MAFLSSLNIGGSALTAQRLRIDVITQNIANATVTKTDTGEPYRRQLTVFRENTAFSDALKESRRKLSRHGVSQVDPDTQFSGVLVSEVVEDQSPFTPVYDPTNPDANEQGYVYMPNVDTAKEQIDLLAATRAYDANLTAINAVKSMAQKALQIGK